MDENLKRKLYKCTANLHFNRECVKKQLTPTYANIKIPNTSPAHKNTQKKITNIRIKDEIKYLQIKKTKIYSRNILPPHSPRQLLEQHVAIHPENRREITKRSPTQIQDNSHQTK
jgi:hypothetical protein